MYPIDVVKPAFGNFSAGFAVANDAVEHKALSDQGFLPAFVASLPSPAEAPARASEEDAGGEETQEHAALVKQAEKKGLKVDKRWSSVRLAEELAKVQ